MVSYFQKSFVVLITLLFSVRIFAETNSPQPDGWQFHSFFGEYKVVQSEGDCKLLGATVTVGKIGGASTPSISFKSVFKTDHSYSISLRTESYETCSSDYGQPCNGSAPDIWTYSSIAGDGIENAIFKKRDKSFNSPETNTIIEMVRVTSDRVFLKYNKCVSELIRN